MNAIIVETEGLLRRLLGEDVVLTVKLDRTAPHVKIDPGYVSQAVINMAVNARDAMPKGGHLTIETECAELGSDYAANHVDVRPGRYVRLSISDSGVGMTSETRARIFEPFFTTKGIGKGTGLGLAVVHGIVKQSGGHVEVYSESGVGTCFKIYLPVAEKPVTVPDVPRVGPSLGGTETVLVVEDEPAVRRLAVTILTAKGYVVLQASSGEEAIKVIEERDGPLHLLMTDIVMPGMSGRELAEIMRARSPEVPILFTSGYTNDAIMQHGILEADAAFLPKPYTPAILLSKVRQMLDRR